MRSGLISSSPVSATLPLSRGCLQGQQVYTAGGQDPSLAGMATARLTQGPPPSRIPPGGLQG